MNQSIHINNSEAIFPLTREMLLINAFAEGRPVTLRTNGGHLTFHHICDICLLNGSSEAFSFHAEECVISDTDPEPTDFEFDTHKITIHFNCESQLGIAEEGWNI